MPSTSRAMPMGIIRYPASSRECGASAWSVVERFEQRVLDDGALPAPPVARVAAPALGPVGQLRPVDQPGRDGELVHVQPVVEGAGQHRQARPGLLVERPEAAVEGW